MTATTSNLYVSGEYATANRTYHVEDSPWKARQIMGLVRDHELAPRTVCEVGCGAGEVLRLLQDSMPGEVVFRGCEISPQAFALCQQRQNAQLRFEQRELPDDAERFDLLLCIDVFEHVEDYLGFLRRLRPIARQAIFHIPLDLSMQSVLRGSPIMTTRRRFGHLHYFTRQTALASLEHAGYEVIDWRYTPAGIDRASGFRQALAKWPRRALAAISAELAARVLGGFSLLVLAK